jgi:hypothetical protein
VIRDAGAVTDQPKRKPLLSTPQIVVLVAGVLAIGGYVAVKSLPADEQSKVPDPIGASSPRDFACRAAVNLYAEGCPGMPPLDAAKCRLTTEPQTTKRDAKTIEALGTGDWVNFGLPGPEWFMENRATLLANNDDALCGNLTTVGRYARGEMPPRRSYEPAVVIDPDVVCEGIVDLLARRCPDAGGLSERECSVVDPVRERDRALGPGVYVGFGTGPEWFVGSDGQVLVANQVAFLLCPTMQSVVDRARENAREAASKVREGDPTACSEVDIERAEAIASWVLDLPVDFTDRDLDRAFSKAAKKNGVATKVVRETWNKVQRLCPHAL